MKKVRPLLDLQRPLDPVRQLHHELAASLDLFLTPAHLKTFEALVLSELLCAFPLRRKHWSTMRVTQGFIPDHPPYESLHIHEGPQGKDLSKYSIVVPTTRLKNAETSNEIKALDPPRVVFYLPADLESLITRYLEEARPQIVKDDSQFLLSLQGKHAVNNSLVALQTRHLIGPLGLPRFWGTHPYRVLVATHAVKNAKNNPFLVAASLLLDSEAMIRSTYGKFRAEDAHDAAREAIAARKERSS